MRPYPGNWAANRSADCPPHTKRFYELGWDALSVAAAVIDLTTPSAGGSPRTGRVSRRRGWLGWTLRQVDHTLTPAIRRYDSWADAAAEAEPCRHDWHGGARISIVTGQPKCPFCRRTTAGSQLAR